MGKEIVIGLHLYQPPRQATHPLLTKINTDPKREDWTKIIYEQCYKHLAQDGVLEKVSFDIYQTLLIQLEKIDPSIAKIYKDSMVNNGVGEAFVHPILPDLTLSDKNIVISAGVNRFTQITGKQPQIFWPPETAIDTETLEVLVEHGYKGFICAPEQITQSDNSSSDNKPTLIKLKNGMSITAFPFDRNISNRLAFDPKTNADRFANEIIKPLNSRAPSTETPIAWTDGETFGHHYHYADKFLSHLIKYSLPNAGLTPISINNLITNPDKLPIGKIQERSSWSCPHGNLIRWNGTCACSNYENTSWKQPFVKAINYLNQEVTDLLDKNLGPHYQQLVSENFYKNISFPETVNSPILALVSAKISSLVAKTSCATFFGNPYVSGKINLLYAFQSLSYLNDAGLTYESNKIKNQFFKQLSEIKTSNGDDTIFSMLEEMLAQ